MNKSGCVFCKLYQEPSSESSRVIQKTDDYFVVLSLHPQTKGHLLVIPVKHSEDLSEFSVLEMGSLFSAAVSMGEILINKLGAKAFTIKVNNQLFKLKGVGKGHVAHIHIHVLPRYTTGDKESKVPQKAPLSDLESIRTVLTREKD